MRGNNSFTEKIKTLEEISETVEELKKKGKKIVHCHGVFDLLHPGHIRHLAEAKEKGDVLVVTITDDEFVNKGPGRPVFNHRLRAECIAALEYVDFVAINRYPTAVEAIKKLKPNLYVKGKEYSRREDDVTGKIYDEEETVKSIGGDICFTEDITFSSTELLNIHFKVFPEDANDFLQRFKKEYSAQSIIRRLKSLENLKILVIGDTIIDEYHYCVGIGKPQKDNIVATKYLYEERFAGGTLAVANHIAGFCKNVHLVSLIGGKNEYMEFIKSKLHPHIKAKFFVKKDVTTVVKRRFLDPSFLTKMFELYFIDEFTLEVNLEKRIINYLDERLDEYDVVIVSDFGHCFISKKIIELLCAKAKFLAVNTQINSANMGFNLVTKYPRADYICIDEPEIRLAMHDKFSDLKDIVVKLSKIVKCPCITITRGHKGALTYFKEKGIFFIPAFSKKIVDRVGAGDACLAVTSLVAASNFSCQELGFICNAVGALAVLIVGNREPIDPISLYRFITTLLK